MLRFLEKEPSESELRAQEVVDQDTTPRKPFREAIVPVIACGAGLFSDGYINNVSTHPVAYVSRTVRG